MVTIVKKKQVTFAPLQSGLSPTCEQRRHTLVQTQQALDVMDMFLWLVIFCITIVFPLNLNPALLLDFNALVWLVKIFSWAGTSVWVIARLLVALPLVPGQLTGATVDAMKQAPSADEGFFPRVSTLVEQACFLLFWQQEIDSIEQQSVIQVQRYWQQLWRRPRRRLQYTFPLQRQLPSSSFLLEISCLLKNLG